MSKKDLSSTTEFIIKREKKKKTALWQMLLILVAVVLCVVLIAGCSVYTYYRYFHRPVSDISGFEQDIIPVTGNGENTENGNEESGDSISKNNSRYTFLALGCDRKAWLSDVIMIATYDVKDGSVAIMQIPRDTYVTVNKKLILDDNGNISYENFDGKGDYGCRINSVLGHGGKFAETELKRIAKAADGASLSEIDDICEESFLSIERTELLEYMEAEGAAKSELLYKIKVKFGIRYLSVLLARSFGTPIDFYAQLDLDGFVNIVDAIGGVDVYVQEDMDYDDPYQDLHIHIKKGHRHLDGEAAEGFIRFRKGYITADISRIDAQKIFMTAFIKKLVSLEGILNLDSLINEVGKNLTTNLSFGDAMFFATNALGVDMEKIVMLTMPGTAKYIGNASYYAIDKTTLIEYVNTYLNKYNEPLGEEYFLCADSADVNHSTPPLSAADITEHQPDLSWRN